MSDQSLRDDLRFRAASAAMVGILSAPWSTEWTAAQCAKSAIEHADALLTMLGKAGQSTPDLLAAAKRVRAGLDARIRHAPSNAVPLFDGLADLHDAIGRAEGGAR